MRPSRKRCGHVTQGRPVGLDRGRGARRPRRCRGRPRPLGAARRLPGGASHRPARRRPRRPLAEPHHAQRRRGAELCPLPGRAAPRRAGVAVRRSRLGDGRGRELWELSRHHVSYGSRGTGTRVRTDVTCRRRLPRRRRGGRCARLTGGRSRDRRRVGRKLDRRPGHPDPRRPRPHRRRRPQPGRADRRSTRSPTASAWWPE